MRRSALAAVATVLRRAALWTLLSSPLTMLGCCGPSTPPPAETRPPLPVVRVKLPPPEVVERWLRERDARAAVAELGRAHVYIRALEREGLWADYPPPD